MSVKLKMLEQRLARNQAPAAVPSPTAGGGLFAGLEQLVEQEIARRMEQRPRSSRLRKVLDGFDRKPQAPWQPIGEPFDPAPEYHPSEDFGPAAEPAQRAWIAPAERQPVAAPAQPQAPARDMTMTVQRDESGRPVSTTINGRRFVVQRNELGQMVGMAEA